MIGLLVMDSGSQVSAAWGIRQVVERQQDKALVRESVVKNLGQLEVQRQVRKEECRSMEDPGSLLAQWQRRTFHGLFLLG